MLGNGTWVVFGGNQPVTTNGVAVAGPGAYMNTDSKKWDSITSESYSIMSLKSWEELRTS